MLGELLISITLSVLGAQETATAVDGYGLWKLGMTIDEVRAVEECGPYQPVASTGGVETSNGPFMDGTRNISFVFGPAGLRIIQIWIYEGQEIDEALASLADLYRYLGERHGGVRDHDGPWPAGLTDEEVAARVPEAFKDRSQEVDMEELMKRGSLQTQAHKFHLHPLQTVAGAEVYGSLIRNPQLGINFVFLYFKQPAAASGSR